MKRNPNLREKYLDGERLFIKYFEMGDAKSISRLTRWAISEGMTGSKGQEPTAMGVWKSMWRWASLRDNFQKAWEIYCKFNPNASWMDYREDMLLNIKSAWQHTTNAKYKKFLQENGWS